MRTTLFEWSHHIFRHKLQTRNATHLLPLDQYFFPTSTSSLPPFFHVVSWHILAYTGMDWINTIMDQHELCLVQINVWLTIQNGTKRVIRTNPPASWYTEQSVSDDMQEIGEVSTATSPYLLTDTDWYQSNLADNGSSLTRWSNWPLEPLLGL